ncbi:MAG: hypothetical protein LBO09_00960 [Candidatus Peribacteria bacterium]|nr:hypothetical protein [Candidatus Peribacteria bacterium]
MIFEGKELPWTEISEIKKARADRYLLVHDQKGKKLAKWDLNKILDEEVLAMVLEVAGRKIG